MIEDGGRGVAVRTHVYVAAPYVQDGIVHQVLTSEEQRKGRPCFFATASTLPQDVLLNPIINKLSVTFTAHLTNWIKSQSGGFHFSQPMFYDFLLVLFIVEVTFFPPLNLRKQRSSINHVSCPMNV